MSFNEILEQYRSFQFQRFFGRVTEIDIDRALGKEVLRPEDFLALLSPLAAEHIEAMAEKAHRTSVQFFGRTIQLFTPLYISNHCSNNCIYCGFNSANRIERRKLTLEEIEREAECISSTGIQHVLLLTGESR